jgi:rubrerythrin
LSKTVAQVLAQAMEAEIAGFTSYLEFARQTNDPTGKNMFITLAREEVDHFNILRRQLREATAGRPIEPAEVSQTEIAELVPRLDPVAERTAGAEGANQIHALKAAIDQERASIDFYTKWAEEVADPTVRETFKNLAQMEEGHFELLLSQLDFINNTGHWFGISQWTMEG